MCYVLFVAITRNSICNFCFTCQVKYMCVCVCLSVLFCHLLCGKQKLTNFVAWYCYCHNCCTYCYCHINHAVLSPLVLVLLLLWQKNIYVCLSIKSVNKFISFFLSLFFFLVGIKILFACVFTHCNFAYSVCHKCWKFKANKKKIACNIAQCKDAHC